MLLKHKYLILFVAVLQFFMASCEKFLDAKSDQALSTPSKLSDLKALLNSPYFQSHGPRLMQAGIDDYYLPTDVWQGLQEMDKGGFVWDAKLNDQSDWQILYKDVFQVNTVLDNLEKIKRTADNAQEFDAIRGFALFLRAHCFYQLAILYAPQYDKAIASSELGIVLRFDSDFNKPVFRATLKETYDNIVEDLRAATTLLQNTSNYNTQPNKASAYALLARVYLQMGLYEEANQAATNSLQINNTLIDYNDMNEVDTLSPDPFLHQNKDNKEILFYFNDENSYIAFYNPSVIIDSTLISLYEKDDLRKAAFFEKIDSEVYAYKGSYSGSNFYGAFVGVGTAEVYLIKAEASARLNNVATAMKSLNDLLVKRYRSGSFSNKTASTATEALSTILRERRKELVFRGLRWADLKRLNKETDRSVNIVRNLDKTYTLLPNDHRYTLLIPMTVILKSKVPQNPR